MDRVREKEVSTKKEVRIGKSKRRPGQGKRASWRMCLSISGVEVWRLQTFGIVISSRVLFEYELEPLAPLLGETDMHLLSFL